MSHGRFAALGVILILVACGWSGSGQLGTGVRGVVLLGPTCPVENPASPCPDAPFHGDVQATAADGSTRSTTTDDQGHFAIDLAPGTYELVAVTASGGGPPMAKPATVVVHAGSYTEVTLEVDTGIR